MERTPALGSRSSNEQPHTRRDSMEDALRLTKTQSHEPTVVESIAVQEPPDDDKDSVERSSIDSLRWPQTTRYLVLLCAFITSLSFGVTQVPLLYVFRLMTCDAYYKEHPSPQSAESNMTQHSVWRYALAAKVSNAAFEASAEDRCSLNPIEASTALSISLLGASTTVFGLLNLFLTSSLIKRIGIKPTLLIQVFFPALRLLVQNIGVVVWGSAGIIIIQCSQIVSIIGGPSGYLLVLNTFITEVVEYEGRTAALGRLTGAMMFGSAIGFLLGGVVAEAFGIQAPFRLTLLLFLLSSAYVALFLPSIPPAEGKPTKIAGSKSNSRLFNKFLGPLTVFAPRKFVLKDGTIQTEFGSFLLAWGVYLGILATGYLPTLLQLYATDVFGFGTKANGWLIFIYSMLRGCFLTFVFPKLIAIGRRWLHPIEVSQQADGERQPLLAGAAAESSPATGPKHQTFQFDLTYTRFSLIADGLLTLLCSFVREGWQMYVVATVLPFAAGTGSAAKGTVLQMVGSSASSNERTDALAGVSLVENMARLSTTFIFGAVFAAFASIGSTQLVFTCNAGVALIGFIVMLFARFPPEGSRRYEESESESSSLSD